MDIKRPILLFFVVVIAVSFFLPWVSAESQVVGEVTKLLTGKKQTTIDSISGFKIPVLANSEESRFMISIIKIFQPKIKDADRQSFLVWAAPLLAVFIFLINDALKGNKWIKLVFGVIGIAIFAFAAYKITVTDLDKVVLKINIGYGLWLTLFGYLGIGILQMADFIQLNKNGK